MRTHHHSDFVAKNTEVFAKQRQSNHVEILVRKQFAAEWFPLIQYNEMLDVFVCGRCVNKTSVSINGARAHAIERHL